MITGVSRGSGIPGCGCLSNWAESEERGLKEQFLRPAKRLRRVRNEVS